jgi:hypothetical protein
MPPKRKSRKISPGADGREEQERRSSRLKMIDVGTVLRKLRIIKLITNQLQAVQEQGEE